MFDLGSLDTSPYIDDSANKLDNYLIKISFPIYLDGIGRFARFQKT